MTLGQQRKLLWTMACLLGVAAISVLVAGFILSYDTGETSTPFAGSYRSPSASTALPPLSAFEKIVRLDLRQPLYDVPPPVAVTPPAPPPPPLALKLTGTILEPGHNLAMLQTVEGKMQLIGEGQSCGGAQVLKIEENTITVLYCGQSITLTVEKAEKS